MFLNLQLPSAASLQRTEATAHEIEDMLAKTPGVESTTSVIGFSLLSLTRSTYSAFFFVTLKEWKERQKREEQYQFIRQSVNQKLAGLRQGIAFSFSPPAIPGWELRVGSRSFSRTAREATWRFSPAIRTNSWRPRASGRNSPP